MAPTVAVGGAGPIVLFDGVCHLCCGAVQFTIRRDPAQRFRFAPLQTPVGQELLAAHGLPADDLGSVVLLERGQAWRHSTAALRIARQLRFPWFLLYGLMVIPAWLRDPVYRWLARHRYRWFGQRETCFLPTPTLRQRFL